ncbi:CPBP family intramembrane metalloprotease [Paenibacillus alkaliterrae]|uniref:CPBP family intramembrane glutamic endopeptidase n=1 Tax=Paenibacillus alkaliterrae TaxID=320909 RepID=UPI001F3B264E|nr:CPBP family intramembrane glutamic endopeptidase [Paenibacillus alkaliterrae]MCF2941711.1 CPBP family intramembrane metalloprotease [Paenibacillus alkaliterrae]
MAFLFPVMGFLILDLYFNLIPHLLPSGTVFWLLYACFFFVLAQHVSKLTGLRGLADLGIKAHFGWKRNLRIGFIYGAGIWAVMYALLGVFGDFQVIGFKKPPEAVIFLIEAFAGIFLISLINDLIVRGFVFAHLKGKIPSVALLLLSAVIYALDDVWLAGFSIQNTVFSVILGLSLGYVLLKSGSIWMNTGIHWGLNMMYSFVYGIPGREDAKGLLLTNPAGAGDSFLLDNAHIFAAILLFIIIFATYNRLRINSAAEHVDFD